jgi:hypothetical protein
MSLKPIIILATTIAMFASVSISPTDAFARTGGGNSSNITGTSGMKPSTNVDHGSSKVGGPVASPRNCYERIYISSRGKGHDYKLAHAEARLICG